MDNLHLINSRTNGVRHRLTRTGKWNGRIVLGYKSVIVNENNARLEIVPDEASTVRKI